MKKILITGANSYVGTSVKTYLLKDKEKYQIDTLDMKNKNWKKHDFSNYDVVFHVAGIAHIKEKKKNKELYFKVNRDLAIEVAKKSKENKVGKFIFMSTISVYGLVSGEIDKNTVPKPNTYYSKSKYEAEKEISSLETDEFKVVILRPPMIYGENSPGNYMRLVNFSKYMRFVPNIKNRRSALSIEGLCENIKQIINNSLRGLFLIEDEEYMVTNDVIKIERKRLNKKTSNCFILTILIKTLKLFSKTINKIYGDLVYIKDEKES